jgi:hypothetical protein
MLLAKEKYFYKFTPILFIKQKKKKKILIKSNEKILKNNNSKI